jgi:uncharacterized membrane protein YphA (DoxX/SURF4 family)
MPPKNLVRAFVLQWWTTGTLLFIWSVQTALQSMHSGHEHNLHVWLLSVVEAVSAVLFLIPRTIRVGAVGLILTFAIAFIAHAFMHQFRGDLIFYAAVVFFTAVHGSVPISWLRPASDS